ncbi:hypothetical protein DFA_01567 [Cavenderia fasciculata]|uniref:Uncharacterized protein n=1 Tax=Cavenderia fasciculata TaxID=261658 RepID=F4PTF9_CACFS|nr:uncharacterized protein DFA_01567 [Cavenderia fasciculata]EGG21681.1 hypothetical protein DFA_01567 [Cavenderia fasciculata]|eukprot:XP_004359531.1 hypothetical protein DFA_01567 [Cavenderia fasciculata]
MRIKLREYLKSQRKFSRPQNTFCSQQREVVVSSCRGNQYYSLVALGDYYFVVNLIIGGVFIIMIMNTFSSNQQPSIPLYVQAIIIDRLIVYTNAHVCSRTISNGFEERMRAPFYDGNCHYSLSQNTHSSLRSDSEICRLLYRGELEDFKHRGHAYLIDLALVSRWWFQVVRRTRRELTIIGRFEKDVFLPLQQQYSIHHTCNIQKIHWRTLLDNIDSDYDMEADRLQLITKRSLINYHN